MTVYEAIDACEYSDCDVLDFHGKKIKITTENCDDIYKHKVEHLGAKDNRVQIWTYINME